MKKIVPNKYFIISLLTSLLIFFICFFLVETNEIIDKILFFIIGIALFIGTAFLFPVVYIFTEESIAIKYVFLKPEIYLWKNIYDIEISYNVSKDSFFPTYKIKGEPEGELKSYMIGEVAKSFVAKKLINEYWDGIISTPKTRKNPQPININLDTTEISLQENEMSQKAQEWIKPLEAIANQKELNIKTRFAYFDEDYNESTERPIGKYQYLVIVKISKNGETDPEKFIEISADLLNVYPTKTAYRGVEYKLAKEELEFFFNDINENGIEEYLND